MKKPIGLPFAVTVLFTAVFAMCIDSVLDTATASAKGLSCDESLKATFKPDKLTTVIAVKAFKKGDPLVLSHELPPVPKMPTPTAANDLCMVKINVGPGNPGPAAAPSTSPGIGIEIWLPSPANWNERVHAMGGGGWVGGADGSPDAISWVYAAAIAGNEGAVSSHTDAGHTVGNGSFAMNPEGTINRTLWEDFADRAIHQQAVKTKALAAAYYGRPAKYSYFTGSSTGGRQGHKLAQDYPEDYDGISANLGALNWTRFLTSMLYESLVVQRDLGGNPLTEAQQDLVSNAAIHACDVVGGEHLGYILDPPACRYDPTKDPGVLCDKDGGNNKTPDCVNKVQANVFNKLWYGQTADGSVPSPAIDNGWDTGVEGMRRWYGRQRGTSLYLAFFTKLMPGLAPGGTGGLAQDQVALELQNPTLAGPSFKNASGDGANLWKELSYQQLSNAFDRGVALDPLFGRINTDNPDLSAFKARGGKLLVWHGYNDEAIPVQGTIHYYDSVVDKMGGLANVQSFYKLYLVPGGGHESPQGTSNPHANPPIIPDIYKLLVDWVEKGIAPDMIEGRSPSGKEISITQPICPYPKKVTYKMGNPRVASSFTCS
jgi:hypothetical protein